jgi:hypothetical protein
VTAPAAHSPGGGAQEQLTSAKRAAARVADRHTVHVTLPHNMGTITLPEPQRLAFYGGVAALAAFGLVDWPVAIVLGIGHLLAEDHQHRCLDEFGEALEEV